MANHIVLITGGASGIGSGAGTACSGHARFAPFGLRADVH